MSEVHRIIYPHENDPSRTQRCACAVMTKEPRAGQVKTRLCPPLTPEEAAALNLCFLRDLAAAIDHAEEGAQGVGCYTPVGAEAVYRSLFPADFKLIAQRSGNFGERLAGAVEDLLSAGFASVCLINSDSPTVPSSVFTEATRLLAQPHAKVVLGPSDDGGYYLIGMRKLHSRLFEKIDWSTDRVCGQTIERAAEIGLAVHLLPNCYDVDERATLQRLCEDLLRPNESRNEETAPATRAFLRGIVAREGCERIWPAGQPVG